MFYAMGHFSKFLDEDSVRIDLIKSNNSLVNVSAFYNEIKRETVFIMLNENDVDSSVSIFDPDINKYLNIVCKAHSIQTIVWFI